MKFKNVLWGLFFIAAGSLVIVNQLGYFTGLSLLNLVLIIITVPIVISSLFHLNFGGVLFPLAILAIIFDKKLGITEITPWPVLIAALFAIIGLELIFSKIKKNRWSHSHHEHFDEVINCDDEDIINYHINFGSGIKYVNSDDFKRASLSCSFGALKVYFDNAIIKGKNAEIHIDCSFAGMELFIPKNWKIVNDMNINIGGVEEKNRNSMDEGPTIKLTGNVKFAGIEITYI